MKTEPKVTKERGAELVSQTPRGSGAWQSCRDSRDALENASAGGKDAENRELGRHIIDTFKTYKPGDRFVLQWRMFPNASNPANDRPDSCSCGCSCGCG